MATTRIRKQKKPAAGGGLETLYTVGGIDLVASTVRVCNKSAVQDNWTFVNRALGAAIADEHYGYFEVTLAGNDTFAFTLGETALATDIFQVASTNGTCVFHLFGQENS